MKDLKVPFFTILFIFIVFFLFVKLVGPIPFYINSLQTTKTTSFQTTGEGKATAVPDSATVVIGVREKSSTVEDAQDKVNQIANKIIEDIKKLGINEKDIKTVNYSVNPEYDYSRGQTITGYTVNQNLQIHIKPIEKANQVVDRATEDGANVVNGVNFSFSDEKKKELENQARKEAVENAKEKAEGLAKAAGIRLGDVIDVSESDLSMPVPLRSDAGVLEKAGGEPQTNITPGENSINITVTLTYETY